MQWYAAAAVAPKMQCGVPERRRRRRAWRITDLDSSSPIAPDAALFPTSFTPILLMHLHTTDPPLSRHRIPPLHRKPPFVQTQTQLLSLYTHLPFSLFIPFFSFFFSVVELSFFSSYGQMVALPLQQRPYSLYTCFTPVVPHPFISIVLSLFDFPLLCVLVSTLLVSSWPSAPLADRQTAVWLSGCPATRRCPLPSMREGGFSDSYVLHPIRANVSTIG